MDRIQGIHLFIRVVETGSFSKAAAGLGVTQPTATKHIAALEAHLGSRLFHRSTRGVTPTEIGALYYERCKSVARELAAADDLAGLLQSSVQGTLSINTCASAQPRPSPFEDAQTIAVRPAMPRSMEALRYAGRRTCEASPMAAGRDIHLPAH